MLGPICIGLMMGTMGLEKGIAITGFFYVLASVLFIFTAKEARNP
jgi:hypothetical protein